MMQEYTQKVMLLGTWETLQLTYKYQCTTLETTPQAGDSSEKAPGVRPCYRVPSTLCS